MSSVFYYSNYCESSKKILAQVSKSQVKEDIHFICLDKRVARDGVIHIILENQEVILPPTVTKVPALLLLDRGYEVLFGNQILQHLQPINEEINKQSTQNNGEPHAFSLANSICNVFGVASDNYSFLDQSPDSLLAKGQGGMRQLYNYSTIDYSNSENIATPKENYSSDKLKDLKLEDLQKQRDAEINVNKFLKKKPI
jgi:hypothetical protein